MSLPRTAHRSATPRRLVVAASALLLSSPMATRAEEPLYPELRQLRELQILVFDCARDNRDPACQQARQQADPLLDHPRLPGSCKDTLWQIREQAVVVPGGGFQRRDRLDRAATDLLRFCRAGNRPVTQGNQAGADAPQKRSGFGLVPSP
jgi:hypothetical protein